MKDKQGRSLYIVFGKRYTGLRHKITKTISVPIEMKATLKNQSRGTYVCVLHTGIDDVQFERIFFRSVEGAEGSREHRKMADGIRERQSRCTDRFGSSYLTGYGVEKDKELGLKLIRDAAQKGDPTAVKILTGIIGLP